MINKGAIIFSFYWNLSIECTFDITQFKENDPRSIEHRYPFPLHRNGQLLVHDVRFLLTLIGQCLSIVEMHDVCKPGTWCGASILVTQNIRILCSIIICRLQSAWRMSSVKKATAGQRCLNPQCGWPLLPNNMFFWRQKFFSCQQPTSTHPARTRPLHLVQPDVTSWRSEGEWRLSHDANSTLTHF